MGTAMNLIRSLNMNRGLLFTLISLGAICGLAAAESTPPTPPAGAVKPSAGAPKIKFDKTIYDFGKTSQVEHVTGTFTFQNIGDGVLKLEKPQTSCGCTVAGVKPEVLEPGEKGELTFTLSLGRSRAVLQKMITVTCNDPQTPKTMLTVKADYTPLYDITPVSFNLSIRKGESTNVSVRVTRTDGKKINITKIQPSQSWIEAKFEPGASSASDATNEAVKVSATLKPEGSPRYFSELVNVYTDNQDQQPAFTVTLFGRLIGDVTLTPESIYWPITDPEKAATTRRIIVRSMLPDKTLELKNMTSTLQDLNVESSTKDNGKTYEIIAKLANVPSHTTNGVIHFDTNVPSQPKVDIPVIINIVKR